MLLHITNLSTIKHEFIVFKDGECRDTHTCFTEVLQKPKIIYVIKA
jgi:hypothetical protein